MWVRVVGGSASRARWERHRGRWDGARMRRGVVRRARGRIEARVVWEMVVCDGGGRGWV
jgi:hypothetical protein